MIVLEWGWSRVVAWGDPRDGRLGIERIESRSIPGAVDRSGVLNDCIPLAIATGGAHSVALCSTGDVAVWGRNSSGQLGTGLVAPSLVPILMDRSDALAGKVVAGVSASFHTLVLCSDGTVAACGSNSSGQLGDNSTENRNVPVPVDRTGALVGKSVAAVAAGRFHSLALCTDGTMLAWGGNTYGQLGDGSTTGSNVPVAVVQSGVLAGRTIIAIAAGRNHSLVLSSDGTLAAWGQNNTEQLGNDSNTDSNVPVEVYRGGALADRSVTSIAAGYDHNFARCSDGTLVAWGSNANRRLGFVGVSERRVPSEFVAAPLLDDRDVVDVAGGLAHSLARGLDGTLLAWGSNSQGAIGIGYEPTGNISPVLVNTSLFPGTVATAVSASEHFNLAILAAAPPRLVMEDGTGQALEPGMTLDCGSTELRGSGREARVRLRNAGGFPLELSNFSLSGTDADVFRITAIPSAVLEPAEAITVRITFAPGESGPREAILSFASNDPRFVLPHTIRVVGNGGAATSLHAAFSSGASGEDATLRVATLDATGHTVHPTLAFAPAVGTVLRIVEITGTNPIEGEFDNLAHGELIDLAHGGRRYRFVANYYGGSGRDLVLEWAFRIPAAWGYGFYGQLGGGGRTDRLAPYPVSDAGALEGKVVVDVSAGYDHSLALCSDGTVVSWGRNQVGQLGDGTEVDRAVPVEIDASGVLEGRRVVAVSAGSRFSVAMCADGTVVTWGSNSSGRLGNGGGGNSSRPVAVDHSGVLANRTVVAALAGGTQCLALCSDGTIATWGSYLGDGGEYPGESLVPVLVDQQGVLRLRIAEAIAAGFRHSLALCSDGEIAAWGDYAFGKRGHPGTSPNPYLGLVVRGVLADRDVLAVSGGHEHSVALCADGTLAAWGNNYKRQLGTGEPDIVGSSSSIPVAVSQTDVLSDKHVLAISAGHDHTLVRCSDGSIAGWGDNSPGLLGTNSSTSSVASAVAADYSLLPEGSFAIDLSAGYTHNLALFATPPPFLEVADAEGVVLPSGGTVGLDASILRGASAATRVVIANRGSYRLDLADFHLSGPDADMFRIVNLPPMALPPGRSSPLVIAYVPTAEGSHQAVLGFASNDPSSATYQLHLRGIAGERDVLAIAFSEGDPVKVSAWGLDATGVALHPSLEYVPAPGTMLTLAEVTGPDFIAGEFAGLSHGAEVELVYNGIRYPFLVNYHGGTGNDLTLEWAHRKLVAWGSNADGRLGNGGVGLSAALVDVDSTGILAGRTVVRMAAGNGHSIALCSDGILAAWGSNSHGQLGNGSLTSSSVPVAVDLSGILAGRRVVAVSCSLQHSMVLCSDGMIATWGRNSAGQLGDANMADSAVPVAVDQSGVLAGRSVVGISSGGRFALALCSDGSVAAWGDNFNGSLGNGGETPSSVPILVNRDGALADCFVTSVDAGGGHSLALCSHGSVAAWGENYSLAVGATGSLAWLSPVHVTLSSIPSNRHVVAVSAGSSHSLALLADGMIAAWGWNFYGQLGIGSSAETSLPALVDIGGVLAGRRVVAVSAGGRHSLALCSDGTVSAWGDNASGQLGTGTPGGTFQVPVAVDGSLLLPESRFMAVNTERDAQHNLALVGLPRTGPGLTVSGPQARVIEDERTVVDVVLLPGEPETSMEFSVSNTGNQELENLDVVVVGPHAADYSVTAPLPASISPGGSAVFSIAFDPSDSGERQSEIQIHSNVGGSLAPFTFYLSGREQTALDAWRWAHFATYQNAGEAADDSDPNRDGESNFLEFCTGQSPRAQRLVAMNALTNGESVTFTYERSVAALSMASFEVQWNAGPDIAGWHDENGIESVTFDDGIIQRVAETIPRDDFDERFARLRLTRRSDP